jgi:hypothetical protein
VLVPSSKRNEALIHGGPCKPSVYCLRTKLNKQSLAAVLDRGKPGWIKGNLRTFNVGLVFAVDIRCHRFEACEADQSENLAQAVHLNYSFDAVAAP